MAIIDNITVNDFKNYFTRDFPYLPVWSASATYNAGQRVFYEVDSLFYDCLNNGVTSVPTTVADWSQVADDVDNYILDSDIEKAFLQAKTMFPTDLWDNDAQCEMAFLYLAAFFLVQDIKFSKAGVTGISNFPMSSRSVSNVSESYEIPSIYKDNPTASFFAENGYGRKYFNLAYARTRGVMFTVEGGSHA